jgi:hypothetical protein
LLALLLPRGLPSLLRHQNPLPGLKGGGRGGDGLGASEGEVRPVGQETVEATPARVLRLQLSVLGVFLHDKSRIKAEGRVEKAPGVGERRGGQSPGRRRSRGRRRLS